MALDGGGDGEYLRVKYSSKLSRGTGTMQHTSDISLFSVRITGSHLIIELRCIVELII